MLYVNAKVTKGCPRLSVRVAAAGITFPGRPIGLSAMQPLHKQPAHIFTKGAEKPDSRTDSCDHLLVNLLAL